MELNQRAHLSRHTLQPELDEGYAHFLNGFDIIKTKEKTDGKSNTNKDDLERHL